MRRMICLLLAGVLCMMLVACGDSSDHIGEAKTPSGSSVMEGRDYESVVESFEEKGFTNIRLEKIEDLVTGWLTDDGEVEKVTVGGDENYSPDKWIDANTEVVIYYHTFPSDDNSSNNTQENVPSDTTDDTADKEQDIVSGKIEMPNSSVSYEGDQWTLESLTEHFKELGFTSFENIPCDPDEDNYRSNIFVIEICTGWFSEDPWEAGEKFNSDDTIKIYYNEFPMLTINNCPDLVTMLTSDEMNYMTFANKYDGRYVEFDGYVCSHTTYNAGIDHIINVAGGDYSEGGAHGHIIRIGDRTWGNSINESVEEGDSVTVSGKIDASWCEYYKMLYVETLSLSRR